MNNALVPLVSLITFSLKLMKTKTTFTTLLYGLCLLPMGAVAASLPPLSDSHSSRTVYPRQGAPIYSSGHDVETVGWRPFRRRGGGSPAIRPLPNGGVQATMPGGCYVICDRYGRVLKENSCDKAELVIATRAARDYLSRRRW